MIMTTFAFIFILVAILPPSKCEKGANVVCDPAKENHPHNLTFNWKANETRVTFHIESPDSTLGSCEMSTIRCKPLLEGLVTFHFTNVSNIYYLTVIINNISRDPDFTSEGYWTLKYNSSSKEFLSCTLNVFYKPNDVNCERYSENNTLQLKCSTEMIYPQAKCRFYSNNTEIQHNISKLLPFYTHNNVTEKAIYHQSSCAIDLLLSNITKGTYYLSVTMYPNVTGSETDLLLGANKTFQINFEQSSIRLKDCPQVIEEGTNVTCICEKSILSNNNVSIYWLYENEQPIINNSNILKFKVTQNAHDYVCVGKPSKDGIIDKASYRPTIISSPYNLSCQKEQHQVDKVTISCSAVGVYPELKCKFIAFDHTGGVKLQTETLASRNQFFKGNITKHMCVLNISQSLIQQELRVFVTIYPHIQGLETEVLIFGANVLVLEETCAVEVPFNDSFDYAWYFVIALSIALVLLLVASGLYCCNRAFREKMNPYITCLRNFKPDQQTEKGKKHLESALLENRNDAEDNI